MSTVLKSYNYLQKKNFKFFKQLDLFYCDTLRHLQLKYEICI